MKDRDLVLENLSDDIYNRFNKKCKMNFFHIMNPLEKVLAVNILFKRKKDLEKFQRNASGMQNNLMDYLNVKLEETGIWMVNEVDIQVEVESEEEREEKRKKGGNRIPSEEDFARAKAAMREDDRGLNEACDQVLKRFKQEGLREFFLFYSPKIETFGAYIFYENERQIKEAEKSGLSSQIKDAVYEELERVGRGTKDTLKVDFEFDSHENVEKNYEGDYFSRLR